MKSKLPGTFDEDQAGKRMKLPAPETWETQVSLKGNNAKTWQELIGKSPVPKFNLPGTFHCLLLVQRLGMCIILFS